MKLWEMATNIVKAKQAPTVFLTLEDKAREAILEMDLDTLNTENGMKLLYEKLDELYKGDENQEAFHAFESFETYKRPKEMSVGDYLIEFDRLVAELKANAIVLPEPVLAYRVLKSADVNSEEEKIIRATVKELKLKDMSEQLRKVMKSYTEEGSKDNKVPAVVIKKEADIEFNETCSEEQKDVENQDEIFYGRWTNRRPYRSSNRRGRYNRGRTGRFQRGTSSAVGRRSNPLDSNGYPSKCYICGSTVHWARDCTYDQVEEQDVKIVLMSQQEICNKGDTFLGETVGSVVLDSGASGTVCGLKWYECFLDTLPDKVRENIKVRQGKRNFRFGDGERLQSLHNVTLPCNIAGIEVDIITDVVKSDIPLLLSKAAMKRARTHLDFETDTVTMLGRRLKLQCTSSGHYFVPIARPSLDKNGRDHIVLFVKDVEFKSTKEKAKIVEKLHKQFSHPSSKKLHDLAKDAGIKDPEFIEMLQNVPKSCEFCLRYKKAEPRPVVGFSLGTYFNETVSMDIKEIDSIKVLHMIDHATRYSVAVKLSSKESAEILKVVFKFWIAYFGTPDAFLTDNGREFNNQSFRDMAQNLNIVVRTTAAQSPWSNGLNERHNAILAESVKKTIEDAKCNFDIALAWAVSAKNTLHSVEGGYSPNQLVFGRNPNLPSFLNDKLPALEGVSISEVVANNLNAMHAARKAFIENESSEKLRRAVRHQIRPAVAQTYQNGDLVLFKRNESQRWQGPGAVIGWESKQVLVKHGGTYIRVHPCRLMSYRGIAEKDMESEGNNGDPYSSSQKEARGEESEVDRDIETENEDFPEPVHEEQLDHQQPEGQLIHQQQATKRPRGRPRKHRKVPDVVEVPKPGTKIKCKLANDDESVWREMTVISKAGKSTAKHGRNNYMMNVVMENGEPFWLDFKDGVSEWERNREDYDDNNVEEHSSENEDDSQEDIMFSMSSQEMKIAKQDELQSWEDNKVCTQVLDQGQSRISTMWIGTEKEGMAKARLVAKGYQDKNVDSIRSDSPTCSKEGLRIVLGIIASYGWTCRSMDIKTAFLQSKPIERVVFVDPPPEAKVPSGYIWKLLKCVYGLTDASRSWYLTVKAQLNKLGAVASKLDEAIYTWHFEGKLHGIIATHVDDFCFAGSKVFQASVIDKIYKIFKVKSEEVNEFRYLGLDVKKKGGEIILGQDEYMKKLKPIAIVNRHNEEDISDEEVSEVRKGVGKLNWGSTQTRPDLSFDVSAMSSAIKQKKVECIKQLNRIIKKAKKEKSQIVIPDLGNLENIKLVGYSDASFANLGDGGSQGGYIIFVVGDNKKYMPIAWQSRRIRRVVKSTLAAETLAMVDLAEACVFYRKLLLELVNLQDVKENIPIICKTDNSSLFDAAHSTTQIQDKRLRIEMSILREMLNKSELKSMKWIPTDIQIADSLTKKGVPSFKILGYVSEPKESLV